MSKNCGRNIDIIANLFNWGRSNYCKTLIFGGNLILAILAVKAESAKI